MEAKYTIIQSFWTKPITDTIKLEHLLYIAALSLTYAHRSGYKVNMHTDSQGYDFLKDFGYDNLYKTLDEIPDTVPTELFAAGKFYAMKAEGIIGKIHTDFDVFIKKPHILDSFYEDKNIDLFVQQEEDYNNVCVPFFKDILNSIYIFGYPSTTRPSWQGSINVGTIGFNNVELANKYFDNYFLALKMYTKDKFEKYKETHKEYNLCFDFILEQATLSYYSIGYNVHTMVPTHNPNFVANEIGYQHLQGNSKWKTSSKMIIKKLLENFNKELYDKLQNMVI